MKSIQFILALILFCFVFSCEKDDPVVISESCAIEGTWEVTSLLEDGDEIMGDDIASFVMNFAGSSFTWAPFVEDEIENLNGSFSLTNCNAIQFDFSSNDLGLTNHTFDLSINGNRLTAEGWIDGYRNEITAFRVN